MKLTTKLFIYIIFATTLIITGIFVTAYIWISRDHLVNNLRNLKELATLVAMKSENNILTNDRVALHRFYRDTVNINPYIDYIFVENKGEVMVHTQDKGVPRKLLLLNALDAPDTVDLTPVKDTEGRLYYHLRIGIGTPIYAVVHFGVSDERIRQELIPLRNLMLTVGIIILAVIPFSLAWFLSRLVSRPLNILRNGVTRIGSGELNFRITMSTKDEIKQLAEDINAMAVKLEHQREGLEAEISERKSAEATLANKSELLNKVLDNVPHAIFWKDRHSIYLGCNKTFSDNVGLSDSRQIIGLADDDLPFKRKVPGFNLECDQKVLTTGQPLIDIEETLMLPDGREVIIVTCKVPIHDNNGDTTGVLGISYDITERMRMEETLRQSQKMEAIGTLAGGIAHDFNNILGSILGYTELAMDDIDHNNPAYDSLEQVFQSALRAKDLVRQILSFSRKSQNERKPIHLASIVKEEIKLLRSTLPATIEIRRNIDKRAGMVNADLTQMHQIVMNLCTNAAHAMHEGGGVLEISLAPIVITPAMIQKYQNVIPGPFLELKIADTGTGIDPSIIQRIFEPFFTTKDKNQGTGMGLAVVKGIVENHGGAILVESRPGMGTTFTVVLPKAISESENETALPDDLPTGNEKILYVDDEKKLLTIGQKILSSLGYKVATALGSLEALEAFKKAPDAFDLIITDHTMPHMTGFNLAKQILKSNPSAKIILCTGFSDSITQESIQAAGIRELLFKPISKKELAAAVRQVLDEGADHPKATKHAANA